MRLCGIAIPYADQFAEKVTSNRIHASAESIQREPLVYDGPDIAGTLHTLVADSEGILRSIASGSPVDLEGRVIDEQTIKEELTVLSTDLLKVEEVVYKTLHSKEGKSRWGGDLIILGGKVT